MTCEPRIFVVHRDESRRAALVKNLSRLGIAVSAFDGADAAAAEAAFARPVMAVLHAGSGGLELSRELAEHFAPSIPSIVITSRPGPESRVAALLAGADDCLSEPVDADELLVRTRRAINRHLLLAGPMPNAASGTLSEREREILGMLANGISQKDIARRLLISTKTVGTHVQHTLAKLGVHSRAEAVAHALRTGLVSLSEYNEVPDLRSSPSVPVSHQMARPAAFQYSSFSSRL